MHHQTDFSQLLCVLQKKVPERPVLFEFFLNDKLYDYIAGDAVKEVGDGHDWLRRRAKAYQRVGYDYFTAAGNRFNLKAGEHVSGRTYSINEGGIIKDRQSFDAYEWVNPEDFGAKELEVAAAAIAEGAKLVVHGPGGLLENTIRLVGYEDLCYMALDDPDLVEAITTHIGERLVRYYAMFVDHPAVGAIIANDDWGFNQQTMLPPDQMRRWVFPWHKRIVDLAHVHGKPVILHSCGNAEKILDDIITGIGFDAKHSFEDKIQPIEEAYEECVGRIALLGGIDLDFVCRAEPDAIHRRAKAMIERTEGRGGWALGTGNSVPDYVPWDNYFALVTAATDFTREQILSR